MRIAELKYELHKGQRFGSNNSTQLPHKDLCPQGIKAWVLSKSLHTIHELLFGGEGTFIDTCTKGIFCNSTSRLILSTSSMFTTSGSSSSCIIKSSSFPVNPFISNFIQLFYIRLKVMGIIINHLDCMILQ